MVIKCFNLTFKAKTCKCSKTNQRNVALANQSQENEITQAIKILLVTMPSGAYCSA